VGQVVVRRQLRRRQVLAFFKKLPQYLVGLEACASSGIGRITARFRVIEHPSVWFGLMYVVSGDRGPLSPNFVATPMGSSEIGAVAVGFVGPVSPPKQTLFLPE